ELGGDVLDLLSALVEHSLIRQSEIEGEPRFRMLVLIREYAMEQLARNGESDEIARRHAEAYLALAEEARPQLQGPEQKRWLDRLELEHDNIRAALETMISRGMAEQACRALSALWQALASVEQAPAVHRQYTSRFDVASDLLLYGMTLRKLDDFADALAAFRQSAALFRADNDLSGFAIIASDCAQLAAAKGQRERQATLVGVAESFSLRAATGQLPRSIKEQDGRWMPEAVPASVRTA